MRGRRWAIAAGAALLAAGGIAAWLAALPDPGAPLEQRPFEPEAWRRDSECKTAVRYRMVTDLIESQRLVRLTEAEAIALLGPPSQIRAGSGVSQPVLKYCLDSYSRLGTVWLELELASGPVTNAYAARQ